MLLITGLLTDKLSTLNYQILRWMPDFFFFFSFLPKNVYLIVWWFDPNIFFSFWRKSCVSGHKVAWSCHLHEPWMYSLTLFGCNQYDISIFIHLFKPFLLGPNKNNNLGVVSGYNFMLVVKDYRALIGWFSLAEACKSLKVYSALLFFKALFDSWRCIQVHQ